MEITVYTTVDSNEKRKPFVGYNLENDFWYLVLNPRVTRNIKKYMQVVKKRIQLETYYETGIKPTIKFLVKKYK